MVSFAGTVAVVQAPTQNREDILAAIDRFQLQRGTAMDLKKVCQGLSARLIFEKRQSEITASLDTLLAQWTAQFTEVSASAAKRAWARLIKQVYEADPLMCPRCTGPMRIIAFIESVCAETADRQPEVIDLPVPGTCLRADTHRQAADREDPDSPGTLAHPHPQPAGRGTRCRLPCNGSRCRLVS